MDKKTIDVIAEVSNLHVEDINKYIKIAQKNGLMLSCIELSEEAWELLGDEIEETDETNDAVMIDGIVKYIPARLADIPVFLDDSVEFVALCFRSVRYES